MQLQLGEIVPGIVAFMDPSVLALYSANCLERCELWIEGIHPFVCIEEDDGESAWVVLSSKENFHRPLRIPPESKYGHAIWTGRDSYVFGRSHVWRGPNYAFQEASHAERSHGQRRNFVTDECIIQIRTVFRDGLFARLGSGQNLDLSEAVVSCAEKVNP